MRILFGIVIGIALMLVYNQISAFVQHIAMIEQHVNMLGQWAASVSSQ